MTLGGTEALFVQLGIAPLAAIMLCGILCWTVLCYERKHKEIQENKRKYKFNLGKSPPHKKKEKKKVLFGTIDPNVCGVGQVDPNISKSLFRGIFGQFFVENFQ